MPATRLLLLATAFLIPHTRLASQTAAPKTPTATTSITNPAPNAQDTPAPPPATPTRADVLRGAYGPNRANNDLLYYHLDVRVDPIAKSIAGKNTVRFKMVEDGNRVRLDLTETLAIDSITLDKTPLHYTRDSGAIFIDFPRPLLKFQTYSIEIAYHGNPISKGRFGGMSFEKDPVGRPWIFTADEDDGCSIFWPCKDQWRDEPQDGMDISVSVPNELTDISNGRFVSKVPQPGGYTQWNWHVSYPINSYDVALNIGAYQHFSDKWHDLALDYYALPEDLAKAKITFPQTRGMLDAFTHYFGDYPFARDGYKLIQVPYAGMEHQSAVAYGNGFENGYLHRDWTGVGISPRFDFIIIHESGHEWFGNSVSAADRADMWIHEAWTTYLETLFVEFHYGKPDALKYTQGFIPKVRNRTPILGERGVNADPPQDQYFKGALMIATLRSILDNDTEWFANLKAFYEHFKYQNILTEDVIAWWNIALKQDLTPFFNQYLRHTAIPALELSWLPDAPAPNGASPTTHTVLYKWEADEPAFAMPVKAGDPAHWQTLHPTQQWQILKTPLTSDQFQIATDLFYINVSKT